MVLKRCGLVLSALVFGSLPLFMFPRLTASAEVVSVYLTQDQTRALFGDTISGSFYDGSLYEACTFEFCYYGKIQSCMYENSSASNVAMSSNNSKYDFIDKNVIVYRFATNNLNSTATNGEFTIKLKPVLDLSNLYSFRMSCGFSTTTPETNANYNYSGTSSKYRYSTSKKDSCFIRYGYDDGTNYTYSESDRILYRTGGNGWYYIQTYIIPCFTELTMTTNAIGYANFTSYQMLLTGSALNLYFDSNSYVKQQNLVEKPLYYGAYNGTWVTIPNTVVANGGFTDWYYFYIECPMLNDTWVDNNDSSSGGGGESSGGGGEYNGPDYSSDLDMIITQLDLIIANDQDRFAQLAGVNSRLDQVNSNLNKIDSHLDRIGADLSSLYYPGSGDTSKVNQYNSQFSHEWSIAHEDHQYLDSITRNADVSLPSLDNQYSMPDDFGQLWNYTDRDGFTWPNYLLIGMPVLTLTVGILSYIVFGKAK